SFVRYPMRSFPMDMAIKATPAAALDTLATLLDERSDIAPAASERRERLAAPWSALRQRWAEMAQIEGETMTAEYVSRVLGELLPDEAVVVNEYTLRPPQLPRTLPGTFFGLSPSGGLGWGLGAALGIKLAQPEKLVVATLGD